MTNAFLTAVLLSVTLMVLAVVASRRIGRLDDGVYNALEGIVELFEKIVRSIVQDGSVARRVVPLAGTIFIFVVLSNWIGIMPLIGSVGIEHHAVEAEQTMLYDPLDETIAATGTEGEHGEGHAFVPLFRAAYSDLNMTVALALVAMTMVQAFGFGALGFAYLGKFITFKNPILFAVGMLEIVSELVKVFSFSFRLFGNVFAGEVLLVVISTLVPFIGPIPFLGIEAFAGAIQALIFMMLTLVFISGAVTPHEHDEHEEHAPDPSTRHSPISPTPQPV